MYKTRFIVHFVQGATAIERGLHPVWERHILLSERVLPTSLIPKEILRITAIILQDSKEKILSSCLLALYFVHISVLLSTGAENIL